MDNSPLARLPPELRNQIFEYAVTAPEVIRIKAEAKEWRDQKSSFHVTEVSQHFRLTFVMGTVCRQMRQETIMLTWARNSLFIYTGILWECGAPCRSFRAFLDVLVPQAANVPLNVVVEGSPALLLGADSSDLCRWLEATFKGVFDEAKGMKYCRVFMRQTLWYEYRRAGRVYKEVITISCDIDLGNIVASLLKASKAVGPTIISRDIAYDQHQVDVATKAFTRL